MQFPESNKGLCLRETRTCANDSNEILLQKNTGSDFVNDAD